MAKRDGKALLKRASTAANSIHEQDVRSLERASRSREKRSAVPLSRIYPREQDTRPLNSQHVVDLKESIAILGLIEPLVVDQDNRLLAGGHRLAALNLLKTKEEETYRKHFPEDAVPVRVIPFVAKDEPERALQIEIAENEQRRDYTPTEVRAIAEHLVKAGYESVKGRPKKGQKPLMPAVSVVVGKNIRTIQRYMSGEKVSRKKSTTDVALSLKKASSLLKSWQQHRPKTKAEKELAKQLPDLLALIEDVVDENS